MMDTRMVFVGVCVLVATSFLHASEWPCGDFARRAIDLPFYFEQLKDIPAAQAARVSDRALLVLATCPDDFYYQLSTIPTIFDLWIDELTKTARSEQSVDRRRFIQQLAVTLSQRRTAPEYVRMRDAIVSSVSSTSNLGREKTTSVPEVNWRCGSFTEIVNRGLLDDWKQADGAEWKVLSDDFLFSLAACPDRLYSAFAQDKDALDHWLEKVEDLSFGATPEYEPILRSFRDRLVSFLSSGSTEDRFKPMQAKICARIRSAKVRVID